MLELGGRHRDQWRPGRLTELYFLEKVTWLVLGPSVLPWSFDGYGPAQPRTALPTTVLRSLLTARCADTPSNAPAGAIER